MNRKCVTCKTKLVRRRETDGQIEDWAKFNRRNFCNRRCYAIQQSKNMRGVRPKCESPFVKGHKIQGGVHTQFQKGHKLHLNRKSIPKGSSHYNWRGGITPVNESIRKSSKYARWRKAVFARDMYRCVWCESTVRIEADHILPFSVYVNKRFDIDNGRTLCHDCHVKTESYAGKFRNMVKTGGERCFE